MEILKTDFDKIINYTIEKSKKYDNEKDSNFEEFPTGKNLKKMNCLKL
jgi:hypothetical protein